MIIHSASLSIPSITPRTPQLIWPSTPLLSLCAQDAYERTALIWASQEGYLDVVMVLVAIGADLNAKDRVRSGYLGE